jgi:precorrin-2 dehydrogenase/sirohydrochlorin ferrochelatase
MWYPVMLKMRDKRCLVAGGGPVAERKTAGLLDAGADVSVVGPRLTVKLREWAASGAIRAAERSVEASDLDGAEFVFAATDRPEVNRWIAAEAGARGIPVNLADDGENGDFLTPAVVRRGDLVLAVSASGAGPALSARIAKELGDRYGPEYAHVVNVLRALRKEIKANVSDPRERKRLLGAAVCDEVIERWLRIARGEEEADSAGLLRILERIANGIGNG